MLPVSEIFCHRKTGLRHSHTGSRRFVHLPEHEGCLVNNPGFIHLCPQVISLPGAFSHPGKNRISAVFRGDVMDQLLNQHRFTHSGTAEQSDFTAFCIRCQEVDDFDSCLQDLYDRALLLKCRRIPVNDPLLFSFDLLFPVNILSQHIKHSAQCLPAHRNRDPCSRGCHFHIFRQTFTGCEQDTADNVVPHMLGSFHDKFFAVQFYRQRIFDQRKIPAVKFHVHDWT